MCVLLGVTTSVALTLITLHLALLLCVCCGSLVSRSVCFRLPGQREACRSPIMNMCDCSPSVRHSNCRCMIIPRRGEHRSITHPPLAPPSPRCFVAVFSKSSVFFFILRRITKKTTRQLKLTTLPHSSPFLVSPKNPPPYPLTSRPPPRISHPRPRNIHAQGPRRAVANARGGRVHVKKLVNSHTGGAAHERRLR